ncbi:glycoside hydrolase family 31 protein [Prolixibacteraceae bacterium Z1-6]|uniref:Glycoside hydrolase family 31 protein n=1 Tax=Draconibacterium aestuarii TaxID=2998507 RepID=A0A9X3J7S4_9BACT|nr:glycoside hydrolase family 31 protein [Prolixibacteraceae bacterium Z1-6]
MKKIILLLLSVLFFNLGLLAQNNTDEKLWWAGITSQGHLMPVSNTYKANTIDNTYGNQAQPLLLSNKGDVIWSEEPFEFKIENNEVTILQAKGEIIKTKVGTTLKSGYMYASETYFPPQGKLPNELLIAKPQYNTWIELMYDQNQTDVLKYAHDIIDNGFPPGVLMIDDNWQEDYGKWNFHPGRFPNPKAMMEELHNLGFKVMLWVCPFVSPDCDVYRNLASKGAFLVNDLGQKQNNTMPTVDLRNNAKPEIVSWWNGFSAVLDLSNPVAEKWFKSQLDFLQKEYGVDGFKFDAGDARYYKNGRSKGNASANDQATLFGEIGLSYPLNEYRAMWKMGGQPLVQRLRDKAHNWNDLQKLVPSMLLQGIMGYYFNCPDLIGGGEFTSFLRSAKIDQELIVRSAQCHALMPMMQFSVAPWRILDDTHFEAVKRAVEIRRKYVDYILDEAKKTAQTGEPTIRSLEYAYPNSGYGKINQQFLIGDKLLVAPIVEKGITELKVYLPEGKWKAFNGKTYKGDKQIIIPVGINDIPYFEKL